MMECGVTSNGLRVLVHTSHGANVECCGIMVNAGSRDEDTDREGLAHFVEHTLFKGTTKRRAWHILNRMESVGGELNAYTNKEETTVYTVAPSGHFDRSCELLADIVINSDFPEGELEKERDVVCDEIDSYRDVPSEMIFDEVDERLWKGSTLAHNVLGTKDTVGRFTSKDCRNWLDEMFTPGNSVFYYTGPLEMNRVVKIVDRYFAGYDRPDRVIRRDKPLYADTYNEEMIIESHQCHAAESFRLPGLDYDLLPEVNLICNILGGPGMNSRLNVSLREKRGLVYTVDMSTSVCTDVGSATVYYGCDPKDFARCHQLVSREIEALISKGISTRTLDAARRQYTGQLVVGSDNRESMIMGCARSMLLRGKVQTHKEVIDRLNAITPDSLMEAAKWFGLDKMSTLRLD